MKSSVITIALLLVVLGGLCSSGAETEGVAYRLADAQELLEYPDSLSDGPPAFAMGLYVAVLPEVDLVVILRPITESEYGSHQIQAVSSQMIDQQLLAAALVLPVVTAGDVAAFSLDLVLFLQEIVNRISGFDVFSGISFP